MNKIIFEEKLKHNFPWIQDLVFEKIEIYKNFLQQENKKYNLTRLDSEEKIYDNYFYESIFVYQDLIENKKQTMVDVGSGSGIPGILIAIIFDQINVTIVESNSKKCYFMNELIIKLNLENVEIINERMELLDNHYRNKFDLGTSRALGSLKIIVELITPYLKIGGKIVQPKSVLLKQEIAEAQKIIENLNLEIENIIQLNFNEKNHQIIILKKMQATKKIYPRNWKEIIKNE